MVSYQDSKIGRIEAPCFDTLVSAVSSMRSILGVKGSDYQTAFKDVREYLGTNCAPAPEICLPKRKRSKLANTGGATCNTSCCTPGMSAYEVAVADGFVGTVTEWLESLQGEDGADSTVPGPAGPGTDLSYTASTRTLFSSSGADVVLPLASMMDHGLMSSTDYVKLSEIDNAATAGANWNTNLSNIPAAVSTLVSTNGISGNAATVTTINGRITAGTNVTLTGTGTAGDPYVVNSSGGGGGGSGTVTSVSVTTANGVSGSVATATTTPAITLTLGAITPTSVAASGTVTGSNLSGTNTGDNAVNSLYSGLVTFPGFGITGSTACVGNDARLSDARAPTSHTHPTGDITGLGTLATQNGTFSGTSSGTNTGDQTTIVGITGTKAQFDTAVTDGNFLYVGDVTSNATHSGDVSGSTTLTLATVNATTGAFGGAGTVGSFTVNGKGLITAASDVAIDIAAAQVNDFNAAVSANADVVANTAKVTNATHTGDASGDTLLTLATVNSNVGSFGSATAAPTFTVNGKGLITAAGSATITPAIGSVTGLGTNVATALAVNVGSAGAFVTFNGALGTPSSGSLNLTSITLSGTKAQFDTACSDGNFLYVGDVTSNATHTGDVTGATALSIDKTAITGKTLVSAAVGDHVLVADASDADNLKKVTVQTIVDLASGGGITVQDEGTPLSTAATTLNFVGSGVSATGSGATKTITISSGGDAVVASNLDQFADVTQTAGQTLAITSSTTLSGGTHSGTNTGDEVVYVGAGADTAINSVTDVTVVTRDVTGVGVTDKIAVEAEFTIVNDSTTTRVYQFTLDFDGLFDVEFTTGALVNSATIRHPFFMRATLDIRSNSLAYAIFTCEGQLSAGIASGTDTTLAATHLRGMGWGTTTSDASGTCTVALFIRSANATATQTCRMHRFVIRKVTPT